MSDFITMTNRIVTELRRANLVTEAKAAINDAIREAAKTHFWFNEVHNLTFNTVINQEYYTDPMSGDIEAMWFLQGNSRETIYPINNLELNEIVEGANPSQRPDRYSRTGGYIRLYPIPNTVLTINVEGTSRLTPYPLVLDASTNAWFTEAELYIRALAKRNLLRDVVKDYGEASVYDAVAEDYKTDLIAETGEKSGVGQMKATQF